MTELKTSVARVRDALEIRRTALFELNAGCLRGEGAKDRIFDVSWANQVVEREAARVGKTPQEMIELCGG